MAEARSMKQVYYDPAQPGSYGGVDRLHRAVQDKMGKNVGIESVKDFLSEQDAYTLFLVKCTRVYAEFLFRVL